MNRPPNIQLRRLGAKLLRLRESAGLTHEDVRRTTHMSRAALSRVENAQSRPHLKSLALLLDIYGASDDDREALMELHRAAGAGLPGWLVPYAASLPGEYPAYIQFEAQATTITAWHGQVFPGFLQTRDYAHAVIEGTAIDELQADQVHRRAEARIARQQVLSKKNPLQLRVIVDEAVVVRSVGGPKVMAEQLAHVLEINKAPNVSLQVIPASVGAHPGHSGPFSVPDFANAPSVVYFEHIGGGVFLDDPADVARFNKAITTLKDLALSPDETRLLLTRAKDSFHENQ